MEEIGIGSVSDYAFEKEQAPILRVKLIYKWDEATYVYAGPTVRPEPHVSGQYVRLIGH